MLNSIRSEIMDPKNRNQEKSYLPPDKILALKELVRLQREKVIVIKAADKGTGIVIINYTDYIKSCYDHMLSSLPNNSNSEEPDLYYKPVNEFALDEAKVRIGKVIKDALGSKIITKEEYKEMNPEHKKCTRRPSITMSLLLDQ